MPKKHYLNDFKMQEDGKYAYEGEQYAFAGSESERKTANAKLLTLLCILIASVFGAGFLTGGGMKNSFYVILPYILEAAALFFTAWYIVKLVSKGDTLREYDYNKTVKRLPNSLPVIAFFAAAGLITSLIFSISTGFKEAAAQSVIYLVLKVLDIFLALVMRNIFIRLEWIKL